MDDRNGLGEMEHSNNHIDGFNAYERDDYTADAVDKQISLQDHRRAKRTEFHTAQGQRNQQDNNDGVEDHRAKDSAGR